MRSGEFEGVVMKKKKTAKWYKKAAEKGYSDAMNNLGLCYGSRDGVVINHKKLN